MKLFSLSLIDHIVKQTYLYSRHQGINVDLNKKELLGFISVMILSGYRPIHEELVNWSPDKDISVPWMKDLMTKNIFLAILKDIHLADNMIPDSSDPYYKVKKYFKFLNINLIKTLGMDHNLSANVAMVPCYGRYRTKQFIR